jgi:hypothetical protein
MTLPYTCIPSYLHTYIPISLYIDILLQVIPIKPIHHVTLRMEENRVVLIGGFARIQLVEVSVCMYVRVCICMYAYALTIFTNTPLGCYWF